MKICVVVGARPNFMKAAPVVDALRQIGLPPLLVHTGQHYDAAMSKVFFDELQLPEPDVYLGVGSGSHAQQTARVMAAFEEVCTAHKPGLLLVFGDVNSTLATALVATKLGIPVAHVEAGLRSGDRSMPEEINRILTDHMAELLFTSEPSGNENLEREGISASAIHYVGNCMIDTLRRHVDQAVAAEPWKSFGFAPNEYALLTLHRPSNVDDEAALEELVGTVREVSERLPVIFPVHPRTRNRLEQVLGNAAATRIRLTEPLPYATFLGLMAKARVVLTDSGGIQEETTALGVPCLTLRPNTERPITITMGTNHLVGSDRTKILLCVDALLANGSKAFQCPPLWDGNAGERIAAIVQDWSETAR